MRLRVKTSVGSLTRLQSSLIQDPVKALYELMKNEVDVSVAGAMVEQRDPGRRMRCPLCPWRQVSGRWSRLQSHILKHHTVKKQTFHL